MATVTKKSNGSYLITVSCGYDEKKKQKRVSEIFKPKETAPSKIKKELEKEIVRFEDQCKKCNGERSTFEDYYKNVWMEWAGNNLTPRSIFDYQHHINGRAIPAFGKVPMIDIMPLDVRAVIEKMATNGLSIATQRKCLNSISSVFNLAWADGLIPYNPCLGVRKSIERQKNDGTVKSFTVEQTKKFLAFLEEDFYTDHKPSQQIRNGVAVEISEYKELHSVSDMMKAYFYLAIYAGCRRGEELELSWNDVDFDNCTITISKATTAVNGVRVRKTTKTTAGVRSFKISEKCIDALRRWKIEQMQKSLTLGTAWNGKRGKDFDENYIFTKADGSPMAVDTPLQALRRIIERYNKSHEDQLPLLTLHQLRHTNGSVLISNGVDVATVARRLGHSNPAVTMRFYVHPDQTKDQNASDTLDSALG